ncbi:hypothetical protein K402DRAFT_364012 [Aulographum hederae CBS 113979]|uniref:Ubiquitin-like 1-activating enzyme E1A n=1 Tax=Aulographum hederae CBS 113979 TaxID=1176131 RepID=A0A6G1GLU4_9PEZI|nr:hypothetical protein K402DRAFT_364012 [Aulographum hederae CBS 113979]
MEPSPQTMPDPASQQEPAMATNGFPQGDAAAEVTAAIAQAQTISADEIALYDRQIRLWGVQAQERIRTANVLLISAKALANEIAKNLVLAGIGALTIVDHEVVTEDDLCSQFFISEADLGKNRAEAVLPNLQKLNPRVHLTANPSGILTLPTEFYTPFSMVIATDLSFPILSTINAATRITSRPFYAAASHGFYGYIFADLISHTYVIERSKSNVETKLGPESATRSIISVSTKKENKTVIELVTKEEKYTPLVLANSSPLPPQIQNSSRKLRQVSPLLTCLRAVWTFEQSSPTASPPNPGSPQDLQLFTKLATEKHAELQLPADTLRSEFLRSFLQNLGSEIAPVTAFLGGQLAQDVINVLGKRQQPIQNLVVFDGENSIGSVFALKPLVSLDGAGLEEMNGNGVGALDMDLGNGGMAPGMPLAPVPGVE